MNEVEICRTRNRKRRTWGPMYCPVAKMRHALQNVSHWSRNVSHHVVTIYMAVVKYHVNALRD